MTHLRIGILLALFGGAALLAFGLSWLWDARGSTLPAVPGPAPAVLALIAFALLAVALSLRARLRAQRERRPGARGVDPMLAARAVIFGHASALVSALAAGAYGGSGLFLALTYWEVANRRDQAVYAGLAVLAGAAVCAAALYLQHVCRLPGDGDDSQGPLSSPA
ncbi:DUF3180 family protein [Streptomyces aidingensis]|uniref:DUF3180 domain-containing protein n=1 Tax=Streptomyces aidingensis TaxID=910347 RepID=A0A1I1R3V2_9ACTN|nr:DUF3180 family protein [Streptomyces aidingensis]SFD28975.1 Protein of unknown function [Streptomyces aidingensis]